jgi:hypothetical protein
MKQNKDGSKRAEKNMKFKPVFKNANPGKKAVTFARHIRAYPDYNKHSSGYSYTVPD